MNKIKQELIEISRLSGSRYELQERENGMYNLYIDHEYVGRFKLYALRNAVRAMLYITRKTYNQHVEEVHRV